MEASTKTCKLDPIPTSTLKKCLDTLITPITNIVNKSLVSGSFPEKQKTGVVIPLLKKPDLDTTYNNYRPVSNLPFISKILEKVALLSYLPHFNFSQNFSLFNSAYKKYHSTETLLAKIHSDIMMNMERQEITFLVLLDLSAAFDTVQHQKILINNILSN